MADGTWHMVRQGEWLTKIAQQHGIVNWRKAIWQHPNNAQLANMRDPNVLYPGDRIFVPSIEPKTVVRGTDKTHKFIRKKTMDEFFLTVLDAAGVAIANEPYVLHVGSGGKQYKGRTDDHGQLHVDRIDTSAGCGTLVFPNQCIVLGVEIGQMNPGHAANQADTPIYDDGISGIQMRLANLGYVPGEADGVFGPRTRAAVMEFQIFELEREPEVATGKLDDDTRNAILKTHCS